MNIRDIIISIIISAIIVVIAFFYFNKPDYSYPEEYKLNVPHVSSSVEHKKYGVGVGGYCWAAALTMLLKHYDPNIEYWQVHNFREATTDFSFILMTLRGGYLSVGETGGTWGVLTAAKNLGYDVHLRIMDPNVVTTMVGTDEAWQVRKWIKTTQELEGDADTFITHPIDLIKYLISSGNPVYTDGWPCFQDNIAIEGYNKNNVNIVLPNPEDIGREDPRMECNIQLSTTPIRILWLTKNGERKSDEELLSILRWKASLSGINMKYIINLLETGNDLDGLGTGSVALMRKYASLYLADQDLNEVAELYNESSNVFNQLHLTFPPHEVNRHKNEIIETLNKAAEIEKQALDKWPSPVVSKNTDSLTYGGIRIEAEEKTDITITSKKEDLPEHYKLLYEMYDIKTTKPLTLAFSTSEYKPSNTLMEGVMKIIKKEGSEFIELDYEEDEQFIVTQITSSGEYGFALRTGGSQSCGNGICEIGLGETRENCDVDCI